MEKKVVILKNGAKIVMYYSKQLKKYVTIPE